MAERLARWNVSVSSTPARRGGPRPEEGAPAMVSERLHHQRDSLEEVEDDGEVLATDREATHDGGQDQQDGKGTSDRSTLPI